MKKKLAMILAGVLALSLVACGSSSDSSEETAAETTEEVAEETEEAAEETEETSEEADETAEAAGADEDAAWDFSESKYLSDGVLTVALNSTFPPFEYVGDGTDNFEAITSNEGNVTGFDVAMMNEIGLRLGVDIEIEDMDFDGIVAAIGVKVDCAATGMTITEERSEAVTFSTAYYNATQAVLLPIDSEISSAEELDGLTIGVQAGTTGLYVAEDLQAQYSSVEISSVKSFNQAVLDLVNGKVDAVIIDEVPGEAFVSNYPDDIKLVEGSVFEFDVEQYGIAMPQDDEILVEAVNSALADMMEDGTYDALVEEYISNYEAEE